jgi:membrane associated rhomboid family serine protease
MITVDILSTSPQPRTTPVATLAIAATTTVVAAYSFGLGDRGWDDLIYRYGACGSAWESLITAQFLHGSWGHLAANLGFLLCFGRAIERRLGTLPFAALYLGSGMFGFWVQVALSSGGACAVGASGAIAGLMGATLMLYRGRVRVWAATSIQIPLRPFLVAWFVAQVYGAAIYGPDGGGVAVLAHLFGFGLGFAIAPFLGGEA